jgi:hypothetical protein
MDDMFKINIEKYSIESEGLLGLNKNLITLLFSVSSLDNLIKNKYYLMKYTGLGSDEINKLPFYMFENYITQINEKMKKNDL